MNLVVEREEQEAEVHTKDVAPEQQIKVCGELFTKLPEDLYIPPDALQVFLEAFQGPLDLLLYLIRKQNIDILDIPIVQVTQQYMEYVELMRELHLELAAEYLLMAAMLCEIKSRLLLPRSEDVEDEEGADPRAELVRRLQEYERFKTAAENIRELPRLDRDIFLANVHLPPLEFEELQPEIAMPDILDAMREVLHRIRLNKEHSIEHEVLSVHERITIILCKIKETDKFIEFKELFTIEEGSMGVVVSLIAILELTRQKIIELVQAKPFAPIYVKAKTSAVESNHD